MANACKDLGLVYVDFPHQTPFVASTVTDIGDSVLEPTDGALLLPFPTLEENISQLESWLLCHFSGSMFNTDRSPLPVMAGKLHVIHLLPDQMPIPEDLMTPLQGSQENLCV
ncbi:hypothetical protein E2C01_054560 [Portunus trituberculatus]|uniref:Uncharacterized protein n=1 Tax=Portunus trituberculatus TaxID=210409 RepID=A0A5B7GSE7_PORTR|nr:hypothetical protein [Portunus trituberculatus]